MVSINPLYNPTNRGKLVTAHTKWQHQAQPLHLSSSSSDLTPLGESPGCDEATKNMVEMVIPPVGVWNPAFKSPDKGGTSTPPKQKLQLVQGTPSWPQVFVGIKIKWCLKPPKNVFCILWGGRGWWWGDSWGFMEIRGDLEWEVKDHRFFPCKTPFSMKCPWAFLIQS